MRGKMKIGTSALILSLIVSSIMAFVPNAFATAQMAASQIESPLLTPGSLVTMDVTIASFQDVYAFDWRISFDPTILKCTSALALTGSPVFFIKTTAKSINNVMGYVRIAANRGTTVPPEFTDISGFPIIIALVNFEVIGIGHSTFHFDSAVLKRQSGANIPVVANDGYFDNIPNGLMSVPNVFDLDATTFDCPVYLSDITRSVLGWQFKLTFDANVLAVASVDILNDYGGVPPSPVISEGEVFLAAQNPDTPIPPQAGPVQIATIHFNVVQPGITLLSLSLVRGVDPLGNALFFNSADGSFANTLDFDVSIDTMFLPDPTWHLSTDGNIADLTAQIKNSGYGVDFAYAKFVVTDSTGVVVAEVETARVSIAPGKNARVTAQLDMSELATGAHYVVEGTVFYLVGSDWVQGQKGSPQGNRNSTIKGFDLFA